MLLVSLTIAVAAIIVVVLAGYLVAIVWALLQARRNVAELAATLETIAEMTGALPPAVERADDAMAEINQALGIDEGALHDIATPPDRKVPAADV